MEIQGSDLIFATWFCSVGLRIPLGHPCQWPDTACSVTNQTRAAGGTDVSSQSPGSRATTDDRFLLCPPENLLPAANESQRM